MNCVSRCRAVIETLQETTKASPDRKCFRMIGGVLVERTVKDVLPALATNMKGVSVFEARPDLRSLSHRHVSLDSCKPLSRVWQSSTRQRTTSYRD